jgi:hypothetical protein
MQLIGRNLYVDLEGYKLFNSMWVHTFLENIIDPIDIIINCDWSLPYWWPETSSFARIFFSFLEYPRILGGFT